MPRIIAAASTPAPHKIDQTDICKVIAPFFLDHQTDAQRIQEIFANSRIASRCLIKPLEWYGQRPDPNERHRAYVEDGLALAASAAQKCLDQAGVAPDRISHIIFVSTTGLATPSLDSALISRLKLPPTCNRLPIWGLGCAGGAAGLSRALDFGLAHPRALTLVVALECCSLTFQPGDPTRKNLIATALFADGAAAVLVAGDDQPQAGPQIICSHSCLLPDSTRIMGWDFVDREMQLILSPRLPVLVETELPGLVADFLQRVGLKREEITDFITHPGGARVIDAYRRALDLAPQEMALTEQILRSHGNTSSVSVLMVLEQWLAHSWTPGEGNALLSAFGPGFSAEMLLLKG